MLIGHPPNGQKFSEVLLVKSHQCSRATVFVSVLYHVILRYPSRALSGRIINADPLLGVSCRIGVDILDQGPPSRLLPPGRSIPRLEATSEDRLSAGSGDPVGDLEYRTAILEAWLSGFEADVVRGSGEQAQRGAVVDRGMLEPEAENVGDAGTAAELSMPPAAR